MGSLSLWWLVITDMGGRGSYYGDSIVYARGDRGENVSELEESNNH